MSQEAIIPSASFYNDMGANYENAFSHDKGLLSVLQTIIEKLRPRSRVLDLGCGTGRPIAETLAAAGHHVHGIDIAQSMVDLSRKAVSSGTFEQANILESQPQGQYDAVLAIFSLFLMSRSEIETAVTRWAQWTKPGSLLIIASMAADDSERQARNAIWAPDDESASGIEYRFMGIMQSMTLFTKKGWQLLLERNGFVVVDTRVHLFCPPPESQCENYPHFYVIAQRQAA